MAATAPRMRSLIAPVIQNTRPHRVFSRSPSVLLLHSLLIPYFSLMRGTIKSHSPFALAVSRPGDTRATSLCCLITVNAMNFIGKWVCDSALSHSIHRDMATCAAHRDTAAMYDGLGNQQVIWRWRCDFVRNLRQSSSPSNTQRDISC